MTPAAAPRPMQTVEDARENYRWWSSGGLKHMATCPFTDHPFHAYIERRIDALSIAYDLAVSLQFHDTVYPWWLHGRRPIDGAQAAQDAGIAWA